MTDKSKNSDFEEFLPASCSLDGINLVEASAGTGKTFSITSLYLRFILEKNLPVESILVVTFTEAATAELKERIRKRLRECLDTLKTGLYSQDDPVSCNFLKLEEKERKLAALKLEIAIRTFDRAAVFTIHSFCKRTLQEQAFETGSMFDLALEVDMDDLEAEIISDFLRIRLQDVSKLFLKYLVRFKIFSGVFSEFVRDTKSHACFKIADLNKMAVSADPEKEFSEIFEKASALWNLAKEKISGILIEADGLNKKSYSKSTRYELLANAEKCFGSGYQPSDISEKLGKLGQSSLLKATNNGKKTPEHEFFNLCDSLVSASDALNAWFEYLFHNIKKDFIQYFTDESEKRKADKNILGFNDLLLRVHDAINGPFQSEICGRLRKKFRAALIDEFQDTDHIQYNIFSTAFKNTTALFFIGDPKQSIYGFRGADIHAYLKASAEADRRYTLTSNWRSDEGLVNAVNAFFLNRENPFVFQDIRFFECRKAEKSKPAEFISPAIEEIFFNISVFSDTDSENKKKNETMICEYVTSRIIRFLSDGTKISGRNISPKDIAVLVLKNEHGRLLKRYFDKSGIPSVCSSTDDIFDSVEALHMARLLHSVAEPMNSGALKAALATPFFGLDAEKIDSISSDERLFEEYILIVRDLHEIWKRRDFIQMFRAATGRKNVMAEIANSAGGERTLTNFFHLAELLNHVETEKDFSHEELLVWLAEKINRNGGFDEEQLRLESDDDTVKIITIHKSKGLEYPVVFCPFPAKNLQHLMKYKKRMILYSESEDGFTLYEKNHPEFETNKSGFEAENLGESLRLLYVAMTRAKHRCYLSVDAEQYISATGYILFSRDTVSCETGFSEMRKSQKKHDKGICLEMLRKLSEKSGGAISVFEKSLHGETGLRLIPNAASELAVREFKRKISSGAVISSFSALVSGSHQSSRDPDISETYFSEKTAGDSDSARTGTDEKSIFDFPKGREAGNFFHSLIESIDFESSDEAAGELAGKKLAEFGFDLSWTDTVKRMTENLKTATLSENCCLLSVSNKKRLNEFGFYFPFKKISPDTFLNIFSDLTGHEKITPSFIDRIGRLEFYPVKGFMRGFMDMVFESGDKFYLVDWKSNHLGFLITDYSAEKIQDVMESELYILQYHLYVLALNKYLQSRIADYSYEKNFGGVFYVFLRGLDGKSSHGIYHDRPDAEFIRNFSRILWP